MYIFINNTEYEANENDTIIQVADRHEIHIPRFCYHKRLSIVASCRMCLVDVEGAKYPQPACSTLVRDGMKINTLNSTTENAQKNTMEFLLINHPLIVQYATKQVNVSFKMFHLSMETINPHTKNLNEQ